MSLEVRATVTGSLVLEALSRIALGPDDKAKLLDQLGAGFVENSRLRFADQVAPDGTAWIPSIRATVEGGQTLRDTGRLMASMTHRVGADYVEYGTDVEYAPPLHYGAVITAKTGPYLKFKVGNRWASKASVTIPARPIVGFSEDDEDFTLEVITGFLRRSAGGALQ